MDTYCEKPYPYDGESGSGTDTAYAVEARYNYTEPRTFPNGQMLDNRWRRVSFDKGAVGVPSRFILAPNIDGLYTYPAAQALRWWFHAAAHAEFLGDLCLETRLVKHTITYSHKSVAVSAHEHLGGDKGDHIRPKSERPAEGRSDG